MEDAKRRYLVAEKAFRGLFWCTVGLIFTPPVHAAGALLALSERGRLALGVAEHAYGLVLWSLSLYFATSLVEFSRDPKWRRRSRSVRSWLIVKEGCEIVAIGPLAALIVPAGRGLATLWNVLLVAAALTGAVGLFVVYYRLTWLCTTVAGFCRSRELRKWSERTRLVLTVLIFLIVLSFAVTPLLLVTGIAFAIGATAFQVIWVISYSVGVILSLACIGCLVIMLFYGVKALKSAASSPPEPPRAQLKGFIPAGPTQPAGSRASEGVTPSPRA